jgi:hypothetical protein
MEDTIGIDRVVLAMAEVDSFFRVPANGILAPGSQRREEVLFPGI